MIGEQKSAPTHEEALTKLTELIKDINIAMMTTQSEEGHLRSRPMATRFPKDFDGTLWFFTHEDTGKVEEVKSDQQVNLAFTNPEAQRYVSVSGRANLVHDKDRAKELWNPLFKAWFPQGLDDPQLALLSVKIEEAEYWDTPSSAFVHIAGFIKATATGKAYHPGENAKLDLN